MTTQCSSIGENSWAKLASVFFHGHFLRERKLLAKITHFVLPLFLSLTFSVLRKLGEVEREWEVKRERGRSRR